ncbi:metallophosphoesterase [Woeseia oceani]|uniref:metallophosphoesterase n=1 Tax=Woeseia oceani TaxID=1548547 RepID=UPI00214F8800|nr:metallophosphoesterase [Woeseia oceani]
MTDPHLFADPAASLRGSVTHDTLAAVLNHVRTSGWSADMIAMTGDLIQDDSRDAYVRFREHFSSLGLPVHCVPGNHDVRDFMQEALTAEPFHYCGSFQHDQWLVAGIDSCKTKSAGGHVAPQEIDRLGTLVAESTAEHVLVCLHHPPLPVGSKWLDGVGLDNSDELLTALSAMGKVRGCLFGHVHQAFETDHNGLRIIGTPSTCRQFLPGSDDFALDDRPPAYRRVELQADGTIESELIWVDA